ncbi:MAG TPA: hypothetical protein VF576_08730 [Rubricoccaceae bacterium]|jgi:hypothetical protein
MSRLLLLFTLLAAGSACDSGPDSSAPEELTQDPELLVGTWDWEQSVTCYSGTTGCFESTPALTGVTRRLTFTAGGMAEGYVNGSTFPSVPYRVEAGSLRILLSTNSSFVVDSFGVSRDRLVLLDPSPEGEETTYRRRA